MKLNALTRVQKYTTPEQNTFLTTSFIKSQFDYCPLIGIFCSKKALRRLNNQHERSLCLNNQDYSSTLLHFNSIPIKSYTQKMFRVSHDKGL